MALIDSNWCPQAATMLHGYEITKERKAELKAIFLEGLIRFLDIYAQTEIGEGIQIDITKVALHVNSPKFENDDLYTIQSINDVYSLLEELTILGLPVWRFLRLSDYQKKIFESGYNELLISAKKKAAEERPCYGCIWYEEHDTFLGTLKECKKPMVYSELSRKGPHEPEKISSCEWLTTLETIPDAIYKDDILSIRKNRFLRSIDYAREEFKENLSKDPFRIPKELSDNEIIDLGKEYNPYEDLGCAMRNERTKTERQNELRKAMYTEGMIRFIEMYAQCEIGTEYVADIKNIALYIDKLNPDEVNFIKSYQDAYTDLEEKIIKGFDVKRFIKYE